MRRTLRYLAALAVLTACGYVAAPALSTRPYAPGGVDFEQALPSLARIGAGGGADEPWYRTAVIEAPARFDLAGIAGEIRPVKMRARLGDGEWTRWTESEDGNPVYFGGADQLQVKARGWRPTGTLHYVNVSGT